MDELRESFRQRLRDRIAALASAQIVLATDREARSLVRNTAHQLKGAGGTYGFPEISTAAAAVETAPDDALSAQLDAFLKTLRCVAAQPPGEGPGELLAPAPRQDRPAPPETAPVAGPPREDEGDETPERLLLVDDDADITRVLERALAAPDREIHVADSAAALDRLVARYTYSLIVLDLLLPDADGRTLLAELRQDPRTAAVPVVVVSALQSGPAKAECFALGADVYIEKPFDLIVITAAVTSRLERARHVKPDARTDPITSLPSRVAFREAFEQATGGASGKPIVLALFELDEHAALASAAGWASAARALALASQALALALEGAKPLAHWSGPTLAALLPGRRETEAMADAGAALAAVRGVPAAPPAERYTFSAGVVEWSPGRSLAETIVDAERQVLAAKSAGGDTVRSAHCPGDAQAHTVLLAEDDDLIASLVKHRLEREGIRVEHFPDGVSALEGAPRIRPGLAILDVKMPGMDGFELLGRLRANRDLARMPILMLTSLGSEHDVVRGLELGADEYMTKPFSPVELVARVRRLLTRR